MRRERTGYHDDYQGDGESVHKQIGITCVQVNVTRSIYLLLRDVTITRSDFGHTPTQKAIAIH